MSALGIGVGVCFAALNLLGSPIQQLFKAGEPGAVFIAQKPSDLLARRNLLTYSNAFSNAAWTKNSLTLNSDQTLPDALGGNSATQYTSSGADGYIVYPLAQAVPGATYTFSIYARVPSGTLATRAQMADQSATTLSAPVVLLTTDWQRVSVSATVASASTTGLRGSFGGFNTIGNGQAIQVCGAQFERASVATTYQPVTDWTTEYLAAVGNLVTQYTDDLGTTPLTALEQTVGLQLDVKPIFLGPELVTNGRFATDVSGWTAVGAGDVTFSWSAGAMSLVRGPGGVAGRPSAPVPTRVGATYQWSVYATSGQSALGGSGGATGNFSVFGPTVLLGTGATTTGTFTANNAVTYLETWPFGASTTTSVDNISVREVISAPNVVGQPLRSARLETNGDFLQGGGSTGWTPTTSGTGSTTFATGSVTITRVNVSNKGGALQSVPVVANVRYEVTGVCTGLGFAAFASGGGNFTGPFRFTTVATSTGSTNLNLEAQSDGQTVTFTSVQVRAIYGAHRSQSSAPARARLSARYNKAFSPNANPTSNAGLTGSGAASTTAVNQSAALATAGLSSVCTLGNVLRCDNSAGGGPVFVNLSAALPARSHTLSIWARTVSGPSNSTLAADGTGTVTLAASVLTKYAVTGVAAGTSGAYLTVNAGSVVDFILADVRDACYSYLPTPQVVWDATTGYDDTGFPARLVASGAQGYQGPVQDFSGSAQAQVWWGGSGLAAATGILVEFGASVSVGNPGTFFLAAQPTSYQAAQSGSTGVPSADTQAVTYPNTSVVTGLYDITTPSVQARRNGVAGAATTTATGSTAMSVQQMNYLARNNAGGVFATADEFISIVRGGATPAAGLIASVERACAAYPRLTY